MFRRNVLVLVTVALVVTALVSRAPAQQQTPPQTELLTEVRLLRQAIESLAGTNARVQIVFGRLQLQEQRTSAAVRRLDGARERLADTHSQIAQMAERTKDFEAIASDSRRKPEEIEEARAQLLSIKRHLERLEVDRARLSAEEAEAAMLLNQEQGRWSDLNRQLEELERALTRPPQ